MQPHQKYYPLFVALFLSELILASTHIENILALQVWQVALIILAAYRGGIAVSEDVVFEWLRKPFCVTAPDETAAGDSVSARSDISGFRYAIAKCIECPDCMALHVGGVLITTMAFFPSFGLLLVYGLAFGGGAYLLRATSEKFSWEGRHAREQCKR